MITEKVHSLILHKKANGLANVELYGSEEEKSRTVPPRPKRLAKLGNLTDVTLKNVRDVETIMISDDIEVTFERPVMCVAEKDEVYSNIATTRPILAGIRNPMGLTCGIPPE